MKLFNLALGILLATQVAVAADKNIGVYENVLATTSGSCENRNFQYSFVRFFHSYDEPYFDEKSSFTIDMFLKRDGSAKLDITQYQAGALDGRKVLNTKWHMEKNVLIIDGIAPAQYITSVGKPGLQMTIASGLARKLNLDYTNIDSGVVTGELWVGGFAADISPADCEYLASEILN